VERMRGRMASRGRLVIGLCRVQSPWVARSVMPTGWRPAAGWRRWQPASFWRACGLVGPSRHRKADYQSAAGCHPTHKPKHVELVKQ
jgi:hypothetical protein